MADEISARTYLNISKSGTTATADTTKSITLTGTGIFQNTQAIGTSEEICYFHPDLVTEGVGIINIKNLDATNYVEIATKSGGTTYYWGKMKAGETVQFRTNVAAAADPAIWLRANTAACNVQVTATGT